MKNFALSLSTVLCLFMGAQANAWDHNHRGAHYGRESHNYHHNNYRGSSNDAAILLGGVLLGAALADTPRVPTYSSRYPTYYTSRSYRSADYYSPITYSSTTYSRGYPSHTTVRYETTVSRYEPAVVRDGPSDCYEVIYRNGRRILRELSSYECRR